MHHRIFPLAVLPEILQDCHHIGLLQKTGQIINDPGHTFIQSRCCDVVKDVLEKRGGCAEDR